MRPGYLQAIEHAYGLLWRVHGPHPQVHEARRLLLALIDKDGQRRGIQFALDQIGPTTEAEILQHGE